MKSCVIAIEGGGTKSTFCFYDIENNRSITHQSDAIQARNQSIKTIVEHISKFIQAEQHREVFKIIGMICAFVGAGSSEKKQKLKLTLSNQFECPILVMSDAEGTWNSCFSKEDKGILSINGTGSVIIAPKDDDLFAFGGLGKAASELMSGRSLSQKTLEFIHSELVLGKYSSLTENFIRTYSIKTRQALVDFIYHENNTLTDIVTLLAEAAENGCTLSQNIIQLEKKALTMHLEMIPSYLNNHPKIVFHGGLHQNEYLSAEIRAAFSSVCQRMEVKSLPPVAQTLAKRGLNVDFMLLK